MTNKQIIIIDGVDVSGCSFYDDRRGYCEACKDDIDGASFTKCLYEDNCYYKQLKRKEQECEELEKELRQKKMTILMNNDHYLNVDQENKKLKQTLTEIKEIAKPFCEECKEFGGMPNEGYCMYCNYNKILQKISECEVE